MKKLITIIAIQIICNSIFSQENSFGIKFSGFVREDIYFDSRQVEQLREGNLLFYPLNQNLDKNGDDINSRSSLNMVAITSRITGKITGPDALGARTSGLIEGEFFGSANASINTFRLRHAFVKLNWDKTELLFGQSWHLMFTEECFPGTISFNTGIPFQPFSRVPQIRVSQKLSDFNFILSLNSQRDLTSTGPAGLSNTYLSNSIIPEINAAISYKTTLFDSTLNFSAGLVGEYKKLTPRLSTKDTIVTNVSCESVAISSYIKIDKNNWGIKLKGVYGQNLYDLLMLGGYAIKYYGINPPANSDYEYTNINVFSFWGDAYFKMSNFNFGLFCGFSNNLGSNQNIQDWNKATSYYSRGWDIKSLFRLSPRISYDYKKLKLGLEYELTSANYGNQRNSLGVIQNNSDMFPTADINKVANNRIIGIIQYSF